MRADSCDGFDAAKKRREDPCYDAYCIMEERLRMLLASDLVTEILELVYSYEQERLSKYRKELILQIEDISKRI